MLTRLKVTGFKNLVDVDISFGPFTCIVGANGAGKSNLFDAIHFLSLLTENTFMEAAFKVRNESGRGGDVRNILHRVGEDLARRMIFEVDMIVPEEGIDHLGQKAKASRTFLRYCLELEFPQTWDHPLTDLIKIVREELRPIPLANRKNLGFKSSSGWKESAFRGRGKDPYISTRESNGERLILLHLDLDRKGRRKRFRADNMPRTVLSTVDALENPTALLARQEMQSWRIQQLEPSAMRESDPFTAPLSLGRNGSHLAAYLNGLRQRTRASVSKHRRPESWVYDQIASRLSELIGGIREVNVESNNLAEVMTLIVTDLLGTRYPASSLSDGTLRFLALAAIEQDPEASGVLCLEEPENGISPERVLDLLNLLMSIALDPQWPVDEDNPLRQVIINTHSPLVAGYVPDDCLLVADLRETLKDGRRFQSAHFSWLPQTWRAKAFPDIRPVAIGKLIEYLNQPLPVEFVSEAAPGLLSSRRPLVAGRKDLAPYLKFTPCDDE